MLETNIEIKNESSSEISKSVFKIYPQARKFNNNNKDKNGGF